MLVLTAVSWAGLLSAGQVQAPSLEAVMARAGAYVTAYHEKLTAIVSEERYVQRASGAVYDIRGGGV